LLGHREVAERRYRDAVSRGVGLGDRVSTRRNARLILRALHADASSLDAIFGVPRVGVFVGHLIDAPGRSSPRFPADMEADVHRAMKERLGRLGIGIGYASAASGGDILFLELLHEMGAETHVVLPYDREAFREDSVRPAGGNWSERYDAVLARAASVTTASEQRMLNGAMSYEYCFLLLDGTAAIKADELDTELACLALWDGRSGDGPGGTATSVAHWQRAGRYVEVIDAHAILASRPAPPASGRADGADVTREWAMPSTAFEAQIAGLLFADAFGFSKLSESQVPQFVEHFLGRVAGIVGQMTPQPRLSNTWGDGLYLVFDSVRQTGECALRLAEALRSEDWTRFGLPATLQLRIAVHAGPVYACTDPVTHRTNFIGAHVSHAARIEPVTPPGEVYASGAFAALARAENVASFACAYVGRTPLAKGYGTFPIYVLHRRT
jgi:class 3 adenylate cyclase